VTPPNTTVERIEQRVFRIPATHKRALLAHLITLGAWEQVLVFTRTKHGANRLAEYLDKHGLPAAAIHGNKSQNARTKALADFKANQVRILVATDIAARGLDIDQLPHVVNYELPNVEEDYVHRIGRTGRAGRSGEAISLVAPDEEKLLKAIERMTKQQIPAGDMQGFDPASVEVEKPEARGPRPERQPRADKPRHEPKHEPKADAEGGDGQGKKRKRRRGKGKGEAGQQPQQNPPRQAGKPAAPLALPPERDPEEFLDDEFDNFGNRADYVPPQPQPQGRNPRRGGQGAAPAGRGGQGRTQGAPRQGGQGPRQGGQKQGQRQGGQGQGQGQNRNRGGQGQRQGGGRREEPRYERQEPAVQDSRAAKQPLIIRKGERLPTLEQLESLPGSRPRSEKPALLTRKSDTAE
jgi:ATP-dependent RNA helicase RhlE